MSQKKRRTLDDFAATDTTKAQQEDAPTPEPKKAKKDKRVPAYLPDDVYEQLRKLAFDERSSMNALLLEGVSRVFADRGLPTVEELE